MMRKFCTNVAKPYPKIVLISRKYTDANYNLNEAEFLLREKEEWIARLLEYMELPKEDVKAIVQKEKERAELYQKIDNLFDKTNSFFGLYM